MQQLNPSEISDIIKGRIQGLDVTAEATLTAVDGRKLPFSIAARDTAGPIGEALHARLIVDVLIRLRAK